MYNLLTFEVNSSHFHCNLCNLNLILVIFVSVAIDVVGTMSLDAYHAATGIKLKTNLFSSAAIEGKAKMRGKQLLNVTFSLPNDKTEIIRAE